VAFVEVVRQGSVVERQAEFGTLETAKTTVSLLSPISAEWRGFRGQKERNTSARILSA
jgi:hypothetical protein